MVCQAECRQPGGNNLSLTNRAKEVVCVVIKPSLYLFLNFLQLLLSPCKKRNGEKDVSL